MLIKSLDKIEKIFYINLAHREDRKQEIQEELANLNISEESIHRIEGYYDKLNGTRGCAVSHVVAIDTALSMGLNNVLILEDDCTFVRDRTFIDDYLYRFTQKYKNNWDVLFLGTQPLLTEKTDQKEWMRMLWSLRATAYLVNGPYLKTLRDHFIETVDSMKDDFLVNQSITRALDKRWTELQKKDRWYAGLFLACVQRKSFSDIDNLIKPRR